MSLPSKATARCSLWSSDFTSRPCPQTLYCGTSFGPSSSPWRSTFCVFLRGICLLFYGSSTRQRLNLSQAPLRALSQKTLFLLALATAKRVGELQALSSIVTFVGLDPCLSYVPQFVAKSESLTRSIPRSFLMKSLSDFAAGLDDDLLLCHVRALRIYLDRTRSLTPLRHCLFVSPRRPSCAMSKNDVSFSLREVINAAGASQPEVGSVRAHEIRSVSTSVAFHRNWSVSSVLESATWSSGSVFSSFYLRNIQHEYDGILSLGPFVVRV